MVDSINKMLEHCRQQQLKQDNSEAMVVFRVPRRPTKSRVRLFGNRGPFGEVVSVSDAYTTARWKANMVIEFLEGERKRALSYQISVARQALNDAD